MFWNHGDAYTSSGKGMNKDNKPTGKQVWVMPNKKRICKHCGKEFTGHPQQKFCSAKCSGVDNTPRVKKGLLQPKCLMLQNYRLIIEMINQGWILRNTIVWHKPNHMPSSVKDRFANSYEPVFMLVKNNNPIYFYNTQIGLMVDKKPKKLKKGIDWGFEEVGIVDKNTFNVRVRDAKKKRFLQGATEKEIKNYKEGKIKKVNYWQAVRYWFDLDAVRVPHTVCGVTDKRPMGILRQRLYPDSKYNQVEDNKLVQYQQTTKIPNRKINKTAEFFKKKGSGGNLNLPAENPKGKNPGDIWKIATQPFSEAHFATFPEKLITPMILSSCPKEICKKCGEARVRITEKGKLLSTGGAGKHDIAIKRHEIRKHMESYETKTIGWTDCKCKKGFKTGIVLDPFMGSGTVAVVAKRYMRNYLGIELNPEYIKIAKNRIKAQPVPML